MSITSIMRGGHTDLCVKSYISLWKCWTNCCVYAFYIPNKKIITTESCHSKDKNRNIRIKDLQ